MHKIFFLNQHYFPIWVSFYTLFRKKNIYSIPYIKMQENNGDSKFAQAFSNYFDISYIFEWFMINIIIAEFWLRSSTEEL